MHCAYACLVALEGWAVFRRPWRVASVGFFALMCFSAVYLDHHWVLDAIGGITYCVTIVAIARLLMPVAACESGRPSHGVASGTARAADHTG
jgi:membrane-associated phospholipid phosphatase